MLTVLRNPRNPAAAAGYIRSNVTRVELLPAALVWLLTLVAAGTALAAAPRSQAGSLSPPDSVQHRPNDPLNLPSDRVDVVHPAGAPSTPTNRSS